MASLPWFRMYTETLSDRKIKLVSIETGIPKVVVLGVWTGLLVLAAESPERGVILSGRGKPLPEDFICDEIGVDSGDFAAIMASFAEMGMIYVDDAGAYVIAKWDERQFKSDDSYARVKKFRAKKRIENDDYEKRFKKQPRNVSRNGPDTDTDTEDSNSKELAEKSAKTPGPKTIISNHFLKETGLPMPRRKPDIKFYWQKIGDLEHTNKDPTVVNGYITKTVTYMHNNNLPIKGPVSIEWGCLQLAAGQSLNGAKNGTHRSDSEKGSTLDQQPTFNPRTGEIVPPRVPG